MFLFLAWEPFKTEPMESLTPAPFICDESIDISESLFLKHLLRLVVEPQAEHFVIIFMAVVFTRPEVCVEQ